VSGQVDAADTVHAIAGNYRKMIEAYQGGRAG
jgi:hypothetical protein